MSIEQTSLPGVVVIQPRVFQDQRGLFFESWKQSGYAERGIDKAFVQYNCSISDHGVLRGLHYQYPNPQGKLVSVAEGRIFDVAVDIRPGSPTYLQWEGIELDSERFQQLYIPEGFAHGFQVLSDRAIVNYLCTREYDPVADAVIAWNDPDIGIDWPREPLSISPKDAAAQTIAQLDHSQLPPYAESRIS